MIRAAGRGWDRPGGSGMPYSGALRETFGRLPQLRTSSPAALGSPPPQQYFLNDLVRGAAHGRVLNLWVSDQATVETLPYGLEHEVSLDRAGFDQVKNRPQRM